MRKIALIAMLFVSLTLSLGLSAQSKEEDKQQERKEHMEQFFQFRRDFMTQQIGLTAEEAKEFFPLYDEMEKKKWAVDKEARAFARKIARSETLVTATEYEKAAEALLEKDEKIARIEREYYEKFKTILSSEKLFKFKNAQVRLPRAMMKNKKGHQPPHPKK